MNTSLLSKIIYKLPKGSIWQERYIMLPLIVMSTTLALSRPFASWPIRLSFFLGGVVTWTLAEYCLHRWILHFNAQSEAGKALINRLHAFHHDDPKDASQVCIPIFLSLILWTPPFLAFLLIGGVEQAWLFTSGFAFMLLIYDITHYSTHYMPATNWLLKLLKRQHTLHHFSDHTKRFGVTSPFWDLVFRTY